ncbi:MAG: SUF system NifU family Fe-S cluster assembly protein [Deinococcus-Thermus bacterium]|jgi:nitrogen fixation NifU-like protein|nr:SUF system NifU family Fe-S cluster assembly protein [Deinococcota bacterium]
MSLMEQIYKQVIVERSRRPHHAGTVDPHTHLQEGVNPSCGDELTLSLRVEDGRIAAAAFEGHGCAISQASADLMAEALVGLREAEARELSAAFKAMLRGEDAGRDLGELKALEGVRRLHARVKCATLPWVTLERALDGAPGPAASEG